MPVLHGFALGRGHRTAAVPFDDKNIRTRSHVQLDLFQVGNPKMSNLALSCQCVVAGLLQQKHTFDRCIATARLKSYRKRGERTKHKKYFLCSADTAMMVLLCHMARPGGYVDLQATFNGMPEPEMSRIVNLLLLYLIPWSDP